MSKKRLSRESTTSTQNSNNKIKQSHYKDLFKLYFTSIFQRRLLFLYLPFIEDDVYILSNTPPYDLLADNHDTAFGYIDLSKSDESFKLLIKNWFKTSFKGREVCVRLDHFLRVTECFFGPKIIPGQTPLPVKDKLPKCKYPNVKKVFDDDKEYVSYELPKGENGDDVVVAWDTSQGYSILPIYNIRNIFLKYLQDKNIDSFPIHVAKFPDKTEQFSSRNLLYKVHPTIGYDTLDIKKIDPKKSSLVIYPVDSRAVQYGHLIESENITVMITRPNCVLFPKCM